ncbi:signal peptidase I [Rubrivirga sp. S365]|uniref:Signal peptidase I n=1 Tax=Rubrivirga litoralis TaxID=3075598 RepID=A0ABU3BTF2_9BACT|nr:MULTISPECIES: signal peptidase I [unclassified Rubrivirga]MDT0632580.1 signal peptidase I [Rubrivirga sp. F394]MDT7856730.1 signal peptidase I [Rubrivirga sp. S365]
MLDATPPDRSPAPPRPGSGAVGEAAPPLAAGDGAPGPNGAPPVAPGADRRQDRPAAGRGGAAELWAWLRVVGGAVLVAVLLRAVAFEAFRIPSTSMEDTLLVGDFVLVSKLHYGPRLFGARLPGFDDPDRGDVAVFNYPPGLDPEPARRTPYIKRVVALPGDTLAIRAKEVRIGAEAQPAPPVGRQLWEVRLSQPLPPDALLGLDGRIERRAAGLWLIEGTAGQADRLRALPGVDAVYPLVRPLGDGSAAFPAAFHFSLDDYGPIVVPRAGATVRLDDASWPVVRTVIERFEGHRAERTARGFLVDGVPAETYTFAQDYYFVLGDNRDDSADSRTWGFVPEDHLIGKAVAVYFSWDEAAGAPHWDRIGTAVR